ncbi:unnamed protein product, partial [Didymodactylos carnosus]
TGFVLDPHSTLYHLWLCIISVAIAYNVMIIPARFAIVVFDHSYRVIWISLDYVFDLIYLIDLFFQSRTGYLSHGLFVQNHLVLSANYFSSQKFKYLDIPSIFPTDILYFIPKLRFVSIIRCNRFLRIYRLLQFRSLTETRIRFQNAFRMFTLICLVISMIHWNSCAYLLLCRYLGFGTDRWVLPASAQFDTLPMLYTYCFYWSTLLLSTIGDVPLPVKRIEYIFVLFDYMIGILLILLNL